MDKKLLASGVGRFYIKDVYTTDKEGERLTAKSSGDEMIKVVCVVTDSFGNNENVWVNFTRTWLKFLAGLMDSVGIPAGYSLEATFDDPFILIGRVGECLIDIEKSDKYGTNNKLKFIKQLNAIHTHERLPSNKVEQKAESNDFFSDEIPF